MGDSLVPFGERLPLRLERQVMREVAHARASGSVLAAREIAKVDAIGTIAQSAMLEVSQLSALEGVLVARTPHAEARLRHIADAGAVGISEVVMRAGGRLR